MPAPAVEMVVVKLVEVSVRPVWVPPAAPNAVALMARFEAALIAVRKESSVLAPV